MARARADLDVVVRGAPGRHRGAQQPVAPRRHNAIGVVHPGHQNFYGISVLCSSAAVKFSPVLLYVHRNML